jgi:hypothetical protein
VFRDYIENSNQCGTGHVVKGVESIIVSHCLDEGKVFVPKDTGDTAFNNILEYYWGSSPSAVDAIKKEYISSKFPGEKERFKEFLSWSTFACGTRYIADAYKGRTYNMVYSQGRGTHGSDIAATFYSGDGLLGQATAFLNPALAAVAPKYQAYLLSHARSGNPNDFKAAGTIDWPKVTSGSTFGNVLNVTDNGFALISDAGNTEADCGFWTKVMKDFKQS